MNEETLTIKMSRPAMKYWLILIERSTHEWSDVDTLMATAMCKDLALIEEMTRDNAEDSLISESCRRVRQGSQILKLNHAGNTRNPSTQRTIVDTIFKGI